MDAPLADVVVKAEYTPGELLAQCLEYYRNFYGRPNVDGYIRSDLAKLRRLAKSQ
jgi:hypothetical protein